jgi:DNA ligase 1
MAKIKDIGSGPMLAVEAPAVIQFPVYGSPKLDGIRAFARDGIGMSRSNKPIPNDFVQEWFASDLEGLDGELIVGDPTAKDVYRKTSSGVMSQDGEPDFSFHVFDCWNAPAERGFSDRFEAIKMGVEMLAPRFRNRIQIVPQVLLTDMDHLVRYEEARLEEGYEGIMIRSLDGKYKFGRSTQKEGFLLKVKRFTDGEAIITGVQELYSNQNEAFVGELGQTKRQTLQENLVPMGTLGALLVKDCVTGIDFGIGTGFDNATRDYLWSIRTKLNGQIVKYKSFEIGVKDKPRFPVYLGMRSPLDMS